jgi:hypothetical protein
MARRQLAIAFFFMQAVAITGWWVLLGLVPAARSLFTPYDAPFATLASFAPGDLGIVAIGSLCVILRRGLGWSGSVAWVVAGAMLYGAAFVLTAAVLRASSPLGAILMVPAAAGNLVAAAILTRYEAAPTLPTGSAP